MNGKVRVHRPTHSLTTKEWQLNRLKNQLIKYYKEVGKSEEEKKNAKD